MCNKRPLALVSPAVPKPGGVNAPVLWDATRTGRIPGAGPRVHPVPVFLLHSLQYGRDKGRGMVYGRRS